MLFIPYLEYPSFKLLPTLDSQIKKKTYSAHIPSWKLCFLDYLDYLFFIKHKKFTLYNLSINDFLMVFKCVW